MAIALLVPGLAFAQETPHPAAPAASSPDPGFPSLPSDPLEVLKAAEPLYDYSIGEVKPWHMKVSYKTFDEDGKETDGQYEFWWAASKTYRSTWTRAGMDSSDWAVDGVHYRQSKGPDLGYFERNLLWKLMHETPHADRLDPAKYSFTEEQKSFGSVTLPCITVDLANRPKLPDSVPLAVRLDSQMFVQTYCFDRNHPLLVAYSDGRELVAYSKLNRWQGHVLAREMTEYFGKRKALSATVDEVNEIAASSPELTPPPGLAPDAPAQPATITSGIATGLLVNKVRPVYPLEDKYQHRSGTVVLFAEIGKDGHIHDLRSLGGPSRTLEQAAEDAVRQWEYKPYLLNGEPVAVETTINVVFNLAP